MKATHFIFIFLAISILMWPQKKEIRCGSLCKAASFDLSQRGGKYIPSVGTLKVLVVFAKFKDDTSDHPYWPADGYPSEMINIIDSTIDEGSSHYLNLTNYYRQMSFGNFTVIGKAIEAETSYPRSYYVHGAAQANRDILQKIDDSVDYNEFDNWAYYSDYCFKNKPDGIIDMIIVIWRGLVLIDKWNGEASLGGGDEFFVENQKKKIRMKFGAYTGIGIYGSGVTVQYWGERSPERNFKVIVHELAHWLLGGIHPYSEYKYTFWGMLTLAGEGICANSFERERLAWLNPVRIEGTILSAPISDYITTPSVYKYHPENGYPGEMYYFENHQKISIYDNGTSNPDDKGIFILHYSNDGYLGDCVRILTADGFWNWKLPYYNNYGEICLPSFKKISVNRKGLGNRDKITANDTIAEFLYSFIDNENRVEFKDWLHGYGFYNAYSKSFNDVFSPWSNPPAYTWKGEQTDFLMEIMNQCGTVITVRFAVSNAWAGKPSKPFLGIREIDKSCTSKSDSISLAWGADLWDGLPIEPDINHSELQMRNDSGAWNTIYTGSERFWTGSVIDNQSSGSLTLQFRARVRDKQNQWSMWSNIVGYKKQNVPITSVNDYGNGKAKVEIRDFILLQNYPNPFNPSTKISWQSPVNSRQTLKIFDILGREIATLIDEEKPAGTYEVIWNAVNLPSGVYLYQLKAGSYTATKKLLLLK